MTVDLSPKPRAARGNTLQRAQRAATRDRVLDAAVRMFAAKGYALTSVEDILGEAGISRATFYTHFAGKVSVLDAIADAFAPVWTPLWDELIAMPESDGSAPDMAALRSWCARHVEIYRQHDATCIIITQGAAIEPEFYARLARDQELLIDRLAAHPLLAHLAADPAARTRAALTLNQIDNACYFLAVRRSQADPAAGIEAMASMLHHFFTSEQAAPKRT